MPTSTSFDPAKVFWTIILTFIIILIHIFLFFYSPTLVYTSITILIVSIILYLLLSRFSLPVTNNRIILKSSVMIFIYALIAAILPAINGGIYSLLANKITKEGALESFGLAIVTAIFLQQILSWSYLRKIKSLTGVSNWFLVPAAAISILLIAFIPFGILMIVAIISMIFT